MVNSEEFIKGVLPQSSNSLQPISQTHSEARPLAQLLRELGGCFEDGLKIVGHTSNKFFNLQSSNHPVICFKLKLTTNNVFVIRSTLNPSPHVYSTLHQAVHFLNHMSVLKWKNTQQYLVS